jgi:SAM-dependent methyltransferase
MQFNGSFFLCNICHESFGNIDGIWRFTKNLSYSYDDFLQDQNFVAINTQTWRWRLEEVLDRLPVSTANAAYHRIFDESRAAWKILVNLNPAGYMLDIGCGYGAITRSLAPHFKQCIAMDLSLGRLKIAQAITFSLNIHNVEYIHGGDTPFLPFDDGLFDLVVLNAVLEWIPVTYSEEEPWSAQLKFLREIFRILRPGGCVYIATENRLAWKYWLGLPEDHIGLPFITLLPRSLANCYAKLIKSMPYRNHTYTIVGYKKLLKQSGYHSWDFYSLIPTHRHFSLVFDLSRTLSSEEFKLLNPGESPSLRRKLERFVLRCVARAGLLPLLTHSLGIVAWKGYKGKSFVELLRQHEGFDCLLAMYMTGEHNIGLVFMKNTTKYFVKVPVTSIGRRKLLDELKNIESLRQIVAPSLAVTLPAPEISQVAGIKYWKSQYYEEFINGKEAIKIFGNIALDCMLNWLQEFRRCTEQKILVSENLWNELVLTKVNFLIDNFQNENIKELLKRLLDFLFDHLYGQEVSIAWIHGDFRLENVFLYPDGSGVAKVIDWDHAGTFFPVIDEIELLTSWAIRSYSKMKGVPTIGRRLLFAYEKLKGWDRGNIFSEMNLCLYWLYRAHLWASYSDAFYLNPAELRDSIIFISKMLKLETMR